MGVSFKSEITENYKNATALKLSASVGTDSFFYAIENTNSGPIDIEIFKHEVPISFFKNDFDFLEEIVSGNPIFFDPFSTIQIGINQMPFILVSNDHFTKKAAIKDLSSKTVIAKNDIIEFQNLSNLNAHCAFAFPKHIKSEIGLYFQAANYVHTFASVLNYLAGSELWKTYQKTFQVDFSDNHLMISAWNKGFLYVYEQWPAEEVDDVSYHLQRLSAKLKWDIKTCKFLFSGTRIEEIISDPFCGILHTEKRANVELSNWPERARFLLPLYAISSCE